MHYLPGSDVDSSGLVGIVKSEGSGGGSTV